MIERRKTVEITLDLRKTIIFLYFFAPSIFYFLPWLISIERQGLPLHFFKSFFVGSEDLFKFFVGYVMLGAGVLLALRPTNYRVAICARSSVVSDMTVCILFFLYFTVGGGFGAALLMPLIIVMICRRWPHPVAFLIFAMIAVVQLIFHEDRYPVVLVLMLWALPWLSGFSYKKLVLAASFTLVLLIYVLQPLRSGLVPFSTGGALSGLGYFAIHLQPIYIGAYLSNSLDFPLSVLWAESIPTLKSLLGSPSVIEMVAVEALPTEIIAAGTRLGSNSSMYFSTHGMPVVIFGLILVWLFSYLVKSSLFRSSLLVMFVIQGPYFVRRSFGSLVIDMIVLALVLLLFTVVVEILKSQSTKSEVNSVQA